MLGDSGIFDFSRNASRNADHFVSSFAGRPGPIFDLPPHKVIALRNAHSTARGTTSSPMLRSHETFTADGNTFNKSDSRESTLVDESAIGVPSSVIPQSSTMINEKSKNTQINEATAFKCPEAENSGNNNSLVDIESVPSVLGHNVGPPLTVIPDQRIAIISSQPPSSLQGQVASSSTNELDSILEDASSMHPTLGITNATFRTLQRAASSSPLPLFSHAAECSLSILNSVQASRHKTDALTTAAIETCNIVSAAVRAQENRAKREKDLTNELTVSLMILVEGLAPIRDYFVKVNSRSYAKRILLAQLDAGNMRGCGVRMENLLNSFMHYSNIEYEEELEKILQEADLERLQCGEYDSPLVKADW